MKVSLTVKLWQSVSTLVAGASLGALVTWLFTRGHPDAAVTPAAPEESANGGNEPRARLASALGGAVESLRSARERKLHEAESALDVEALRVVLAEIPGSEQVHLRDLGGGIVEALGAASDPHTVQQVLAALRSAPGVTVVVNRIWTPASARERKPDLSHIPRVRRDTNVN
jgi:hypothetical protein